MPGFRQCLRKAAFAISKLQGHPVLNVKTLLTLGARLEIASMREECLDQPRFTHLTDLEHTTWNLQEVEAESSLLFACFANSHVKDKHNFVSANFTCVHSLHSSHYSLILSTVGQHLLSLGQCLMLRTCVAARQQETISCSYLQFEPCMQGPPFCRVFQNPLKIFLLQSRLRGEQLLLPWFVRPNWHKQCLAHFRTSGTKVISYYKLQIKMWINSMDS